jgi:hypothetical protein
VARIARNIVGYFASAAGAYFGIGGQAMVRRNLMRRVFRHAGRSGQPLER